MMYSTSPKLSKSLGTINNYDGGYFTLNISNDNDCLSLINTNGRVNSTTTTVPSSSNKISAVGAASYIYDLAGNITGDGINTYTWNAAGQLETVKVGATTVGTYTYDYLGRRAKKVAGATTTHYAYAPNGLLYGEYSSTGTLVKEYVYLNDAPLAQIATGSPEVLTYFHTDHLGTPRYATNTSGATVWTWPNDAFGISTPTGTVTVNLRMPGQYFDSESGNFYNWNRYYNPRIGRYISPDPIGQEGGLNLFNYVGQNPVMGVDPMGLEEGITIYVPVPKAPFPVFAPGTPENKEWTQWVLQTTSEASRQMAYCIFAGPTTSACMMSKNFNDGISIQSEICDPQDLDKVPEKEANDVAKEHGYKDAHAVKKGRSRDGANIYKDKKTGKYYVWDGKRTSEPEIF